MIEFLKNLLPSWALVIIVLGVTFLYLTRKSWNKVVDDAAIKIRTKIFNFDRKGEERQKNIKDSNNEESKKIKALYERLGVSKADDIYVLLETNKKVVEESKVQQNTLFNLWRHYMLSFLNLFLVPRSKLCLLWITANPKSTKELILLKIEFPKEFENKEMEKEAVFSALLSHSLIQKNQQDLYSVTNIGIDFLKFVGFLK